jgi:hypothetical protein
MDCQTAFFIIALPVFVISEETDPTLRFSVDVSPESRRS